MRRSLPILIVSGVFVIALGIGTLIYRSHRLPAGPPAAAGQPGAEPAHVRGNPTAPAVLEVFGDFECMPCFLLWPALRNLEKDFGDRLAVTFRECPLPQHQRAPEGARAAEAAGLQGKFWEMHDVLYLSRRLWLRSSDMRSVFNDFASQMKIDVTRFNRDMDGDEVKRRLAADAARSASLRIDRTPALFLNGRRLELQGDVEAGIRSDLEAELKQGHPSVEPRRS